MADNPTSSGAHNDGINQQYSIIGVQGTLGTADTKGTAYTMPIGVDPSTGAAYVYNLGPAGSVSLGNITGGTINRIDEIGTLPAITMGDLTGGTIDILTDGTVGIKGTVPISGTVVTTMGDLSGGTIDVLTTGSIVVTNGTIASLGTVSGIGVVGNVNGGSIVMTGGTISELTPGTAVGNLGKRYAQTAGSTDVGVAVLAKVLSSDSHDNNNADGQYGRLSITDFRELRTRDQRAIDLANCNVSSDYTALSNDTTGIAGTTNHVFGTAALTFNKVDGAANTVYGGVSKSVGTVNVSEIFEAGGFVGLGAYIPDITNVVNVFLRIGTDANNYNCWTWPVASLTAATWLNLRVAAASPDASRSVGSGWNPSAISYVAFGVEFNSESNTLAGMIFDHVHIVGGRVTSSDINAAITSSVTTPNVNIQRVGGVATSTNNGAVGAGVLRVTVANDSSGTLAGIGKVGNVNDGTIAVRAGTIASVGTVPGVGVIGAITTGTIANSGTTTGVGTVTGVGVIGAITTGTIANSGTTTGVGVVGNVNGGSIVVTAGTIGRVTTGSIVVTNGTVASVGTIPGIGIVGNVNNGSIVVTNGTLASSGTTTGVGVVGNVNNGSIVVTNGTVASVGTIPGVGVVGTLTGAGTVAGVGIVGNVNTGSIAVTAGTVKINDPLSPLAYDNIAISYPDGTTETYVFKTGATPTGTITLVYLDTAKGSLSTVTKS